MIEPRDGVAARPANSGESSSEIVRHGERALLALEHAVDGHAFVRQDA